MYQEFPVARHGAAVCGIDGGPFPEPARELQRYLTAITGGRFAGTYPRTIRFRSEDRGLSGFACGPEAGDYIIRAGNETAAYYAVYDLLERLGCRFYTSQIERIPKCGDLTLPGDAFEANSPFSYREVYYRDYADASFARKRKVAPAGRKEQNGWGLWVHSFQVLLPQEEFQALPECFALFEGQRIPDGQPCLTNPQTLEIVCRNLKQRMDANPQALYWSVSQNDNARHCQCPACQALDQRDGSPMGSLLGFVNQVALRFPEKTISTLAYWYTRKPPKYTRPAKNVQIILCNIEALRGEPIAEDPRCAGTVEELQAWAAICGNVFLWDYNIQFANLVSPFPNLHTLGPNIRFFAANHVRALFSQCNREIGGEFAGLRGYLLSKLLWDPQCDEYAHALDYLDGCYGPAGTHILRYLRRLHQASRASGRPLGIFMGPVQAKNSYLTPALFDACMADFDQAEAAVAEDPVLLERVRIARMPLWYAGLLLRYHSREARRVWADGFAHAAARQGLEMVEEWGITTRKFLQDIRAELESPRFDFRIEHRQSFAMLGISCPSDPIDVYTQSEAFFAPVGTDLVLPKSSAFDLELYWVPGQHSDLVGPRLGRTPESIPEGLEMVTFPEGDYISVTCDPADLPDARDALAAHLRERHLRPGGESYVLLHYRGRPSLYTSIRSE